VLPAVLRAAAFTAQRSARMGRTQGAIAVAPRLGWLKRIATTVAAIAVGFAALCFAAQPASAQNAYIPNAADNTVSVIATASNTVAATIPVGNRPQGVAVSPDGGTVYVTNMDDDTVSAIATASNTVTATIALPVFSEPYGVAVSPDGSTVYVGNHNLDNVSVIATASNTLTTTIEVGDLPYGVAVSPDGSTVYVTNSPENTVSVIATASNTVTATITIGPIGSGIVYGVAVSPDGSTVYVANGKTNTVAVIATASNTVTATIPVGNIPFAFGNFIRPPLVAVARISPASGPAGTSVTITGTGFTGTTAVTFGGTAASFEVNGVSSITAIAPAGSGTVDVKVTNALATSRTSAVDGFTYTGPIPTVTALSPSSGPVAGGASVTITGTNFSGVTAVKFGPDFAATFTVNSSTSITAISPAGTGTVDVTVTTSNGTSATSPSDQYIYVTGPTVSAVSPDSGPTTGGTSVTITGTSFTGATGVSFGGAAATNVNVVNATSITATSPAGSGIVDVTVTTAGGTSATRAEDGFTYMPTLSVGVSGHGTVTSTPSGISCGSTCSASFASGTQVTLTETPASGWVFSGWSGACSGAGSCVVTMNAAESVTAAFLIAQGGGGLTRTFVSSSGVDTNPCTVTAPCATFAQAFTLTQPTGIIAALDPGKYGPLTITYPVTVNGNGWAAITATPQGNGITINADVGNVILTGLEVDGAGAAYNGIVFNSGASLTVSNCIVQDFISNNSVTGNGIMIAPTSGTIDFTIVNTIALNNASAGIHYLPASGSATTIGAIDHVTVANNAIGIAVDLSAASGGSAAVTISNSVANNNSSDGIVTASAAGTVIVTVDRDEVSSNGIGVSVGANTSVLLSRSVIANNSTYGISNSGTAGSSNDNRIAGNGSGNVNGNALTGMSQQ
jgi:large repetitive protein